MVDQVPLVPIVESESTVPDADTPLLPATFGEQFQAARDIVFETSGTGFAYFEEEKQRIREADKNRIPFKELNEMFPDASYPFHRDMPMAEALEVMRRDRFVREKQEVIESSGSSIGGALGNIYGNIEDYRQAGINAAITAALPVLGATLAASRVGAQIPKTVAFLRSTSTGAVLSKNIGENIVSQALADIPKITSEDYDYGATDVFENVSSAVIFAGLTTAIDAGIRYGANKYKNRAIRGTEQQSFIETTNRLLNDEKPSVERIVLEQAKKQSGEFVPGSKFTADDATYRPILPDQPIRGFYPSKDSIGVTELSPGNIITDDLGPVAAFTDNPFVANGSGASFAEVNIPPGKYIDASLPPDDAVKGTIKPILEKLGIKDVDSYFKSNSLYDAIQRIVANESALKIDEGTVAGFYKSLKDSGIDGFHYKSSNLDGVQTNDHNIIAVFDQSKASRVVDHKSSESVHGSLTEDEIGSIKDAESSDRHLFDDKIESKIVEEVQDLETDKTLSDLNNEAQELEAFVKQQEADGYLSEEDIKELGDIKTEEQKDNLILDVMRKADICLGS